MRNVLLTYSCPTAGQPVAALASQQTGPGLPCATLGASLLADCTVAIAMRGMRGPFHRWLLRLVCLSLVACGGTSVRETPPGASAAATVPAAATVQRMPVYVIRRGWHVDIGIAVTDVQPQLEPVAAAFPDSSYLLFGFGERG